MPYRVQQEIPDQSLQLNELYMAHGTGMSCVKTSTTCSFIVITKLDGTSHILHARLIKSAMYLRVSNLNIEVNDHP